MTSLPGWLQNLKTDDIDGGLAAEFDGSLSGLGVELGNSTYNMSEALLALPVFKSEVLETGFQYILGAATSPATKMNEETLTYLNQGQSYEIKLKKHHYEGDTGSGLVKSIVRVIFHERRLQYMEREHLDLWRQERKGERMIDIDVPLCYGISNIVIDSHRLNSAQFCWDMNKGAGIFIKVHCISTEFTAKKHGGEKGVPFRVQVETYENNDVEWKLLHCASCQIKVFKPKGADRKHKTDREKMFRRTEAEKEKYQPSYDCTVLTEIPVEQVQTYLEHIQHQEQMSLSEQLEMAHLYVDNSPSQLPNPPQTPSPKVDTLTLTTSTPAKMTGFPLDQSPSAPNLMKSSASPNSPATPQTQAKNVLSYASSPTPAAKKSNVKHSKGGKVGSSAKRRNSSQTSTTSSISSRASSESNGTRNFAVISDLSNSNSGSCDSRLKEKIIHLPSPVASAKSPTQDDLSPEDNAATVASWLNANRFGAYVKIFQNFSGSDLLRLNRDDLIQICGLADGIRLNNALQSRLVRPRLTIYVRQGSSSNTTLPSSSSQKQSMLVAASRPASSCSEAHGYAPLAWQNTEGRVMDLTPSPMPACHPSPTLHDSPLFQTHYVPPHCPSPGSMYNSYSQMLWAGGEWAGSMSSLAPYYGYFDSRDFNSTVDNLVNFDTAQHHLSSSPTTPTGPAPLPHVTNPMMENFPHQMPPYLQQPNPSHHTPQTNHPQATHQHQSTSNQHQPTSNQHQPTSNQHHQASSQPQQGSNQHQQGSNQQSSHTQHFMVQSNCHPPAPSLPPQAPLPATSMPPNDAALLGPLTSSASPTLTGPAPLPSQPVVPCAVNSTSSAPRVIPGKKQISTNIKGSPVPSSPSNSSPPKALGSPPGTGLPTKIKRQFVDEPDSNDEESTITNSKRQRTRHLQMSRKEVYHALYLEHISMEMIMKKLAELYSIPHTCFLEAYLKGPDEILILMTDSVVYNFRDNSRYSVEAIQDDDLPEKYNLLLKPLD